MNSRGKGNVNTKVLQLLAKVNRNVDLTNEVQTEIDPNVYFNRNSVNLLVGKKGSGKTYNVFRASYSNGAIGPTSPQLG